MSDSQQRQKKKGKNRIQTFEITSKIFITNIYSEKNEKFIAADFKKLFKNFGTIKKLTIRKSKTGIHYFGFIQYLKVKEAVKAIKEMNQYEYNQQKIKVRQDRQNQGCFFCKKVGHFTKQCPLRNQQGMVGYKYNQLHGYTKQGRQSHQKQLPKSKQKVSSSVNLSEKKRSPSLQKSLSKQQKVRELQQKIFSDQQLVKNVHFEKVQNERREYEPRVIQKQYGIQFSQKYYGPQNQFDGNIMAYGYDDKGIQRAKFASVHYQQNDQPFGSIYQRNRDTLNNRNGQTRNYQNFRDYEGMRKLRDFRDYSHIREYRDVRELGFRDQMAYRDFVDSQYLRSQNYIRGPQPILYKNYELEKIRDFDYQREMYGSYPHIRAVQRGVKHQSIMERSSSSSSDSTPQNNKNHSKSKDKKHRKKHKKEQKRSYQRSKKKSSKNKEKKSKHKQKKSKSKKNRKRSVSSSSPSSSSSSSSSSSESFSDRRQYYQHTQNSKKDSVKSKELFRQKELNGKYNIGPLLDQEKQRKTGNFDDEEVQKLARKWRV